ncbi:hypothetical protein LTR91_015195 [Friedmanniomyces endolithicus]|uniref:Uncharacterized protein n=1 Tax=Friedmanniomyces endolithicus TaxID=329885 RepID=A0AAN6KA95_9PEZI|nr:hypothetical protein LTR94_015490 [Friedmanniomyces endolithicus]KAK0781090.1 hypothetical protein LTR59_012604 [Friedmanniomyces endolithicus]KAK0792586.1 hypothetical protein LTR38_009821 [Friedmanniomyces endolithicus]KAK0805904.1 hypothetical protein LTR75_007170 [Friedmanniomyces endolithicus]KAK0854359.1 hypothetical protein LTR03_002390 [Friedmanniomyces endolithicus]
MSRHLDDRYVWLGFGIFFVAAAYGIRYAITDIVQLTVLVPFEVPAKTVTESPEDSISLATLKTLATSPNPSIAASAISLIIDRYYNSRHSCQNLDEDCLSLDPAVQRQCRTAMDFLVDWPSTPGGLRRYVRAMTAPPSAAHSAWSGDENLEREPLPDMPSLMPGSRIEEGAVGEDWVSGVELRSVEVEGWRNVVPRERDGNDEGEEMSEEGRRRSRREAVVVHMGGG